MTDTRMVRLEQIAAGPLQKATEQFVRSSASMIKATGRAPTLRCKQIGDATGGDVYEPISGLEAGIAEGLRRAKWPHLVQVEVVNG